MDQKFIAGIGNIYSDEILFEAGLRWDRTPRLAVDPGGAPAVPGDGRDAAGGDQAPGLVARRRAVRRPVRPAGELPAAPQGVRPGGPGVPPLPARPSRKAKFQGRTTFYCPRRTARAGRPARTASSSATTLRVPRLDLALGQKKVERLWNLALTMGTGSGGRPCPPGRRRCGASGTRRAGRRGRRTARRRASSRGT